MVGRRRKINWPLRIIGGLAAVAIILAVALGTVLFETALRPSNLVGFRLLSIPDPGNPPISASVWYPTNAKPGFVFLGFSGERVAKDAPIIGDGLPLIIISHGTGGGPPSHADTALALAGAGFVVIAPMHPGDNYQEDGAVGTAHWLPDRAQNIKRVADYMLTEWDGRAHLKPDRIGVFGFSAGATTALIAIGGEPDLSMLAPHCRTQPEFVCILFPAANLAQLSARTDWTHDSRIKAAVIAAPGLSFAFSPSGLSHVTAAVQLWQGDQDQTVPYATNAGIVRRSLPSPPDFHAVVGADHYSFLVPCYILGPPRICQDRPGFDRAAFHDAFNNTVVSFFRARLAGE